MDLNNPSDLAEKLSNYDSLKEEMKLKVESSKKYFLDYCTDKKKQEILKRILNEYEYLSKRWSKK